MSRSIHATRASLARLLAAENVRAEAVERERRALDRKRGMKRGAAVDRRPRERGHTAPETIPVVVERAGPHAHFPAGEDDVRELLRRLPRGVTDGLARVELRLGRETQAELAVSDPGGEEPDPLTRRLSYPRFPGVWTGRTLGFYRPDAAVIELYACVYDAARPLPVAWETLLRLEALEILAHEAAHHHDHTERVARGRWTAEDREAVERYAEAMQHHWTRSVVLPYLRERYADEVAETERWVARHGGIALPFESLADDPRVTGRGGLLHCDRLWTMRAALEELAGAVERGEPAWACRTHFARWLYYQARYDDALAVVGGVLGARPEEPRALLLKGDVLARQGRHAEALAIGRALAGHGPLLEDEAWQIVANACQKLGQWSEAEAALAVRLELAAAEGGPTHRLLLQRAEVRIDRGDLAGAARDLDAVESDRHWILRRVAKLRARIEAVANPTVDGGTSARPTADAS